MSRWHAVPLAASRSPAVAGLSLAARMTWLALRAAHAEYGLGGVVPATHASAAGLAMAAPAYVHGVDVADALAELGAAGLIRAHDDGVALGDWDAAAEQAPCSSCRRRNPDPRHSRCPACRARDTDPDRRASRQRGADHSAAGTARPGKMAQTRRAPRSDAEPQQQRGLAVVGHDLAQTERRDGADRARPIPDPTRQYSDHQTRAGAREAPAPPAGDPISRGSPDVRDTAGAWAVTMARRGIERLAAEHAPDVAALLAAVGQDPPHVHDPAALARARCAAAERVIRWCPSPERLARWCVVAVRRYRARNVAGYLVRASERGDPGTLLAAAGQGERVLGQPAEQALLGRHVADVARLLAGGAAVLGTGGAERERLRADLRDLLAAGRTAAARAVLLRLVDRRDDDATIEAAVGGILPVAAARRLIA